MSKGPYEVEPRSLHFLIWPALLLLIAIELIVIEESLRCLVWLLLG